MGSPGVRGGISARHLNGNPDMSFNDKDTLDYRTRGGIRVERRLIRQPYAIPPQELT
jgi:hypothetical protein